MVDYSFDRQIELEQLQSLLRQTGWANQRSIEGIEKMLEGTPSSWERGRVTSCRLCPSDDRWYLPGIDRRCGCGGIETRNRYRFRIDATGSRAVGRVEEVFLRCGEHVVPFYERHSFERSNGVIMDLKKD